MIQEDYFLTRYEWKSENEPGQKKGWFRFKDDGLVKVYFHFASLSNQQI